MSLRPPTEHENGGISLHRVLSSTRHSRARGNPGLFGRISLDTRFSLRLIRPKPCGGFAGTTEPSGLFVLQIIPAHVFSKEDTKSTKFGSKNIRNLRVLRALRGKQNKLSVIHYPHKSLKNQKFFKITESCDRTVARDAPRIQSLLCRLALSRRIIQLPFAGADDR